jgi:hypothetical protein
VSVGSTGHDAEIEALVVDRYLESLLARRPVEIDGVPPELDATARRLAGALPRFHPSFRFEEALSARLAAVAGRIAGGEVVAFPTPDIEPALRPVPLQPPGPSDRPAALSIDRPFVGRPAVIGGVLTSAVLSIAGAAYVAWRLNRSPLDPMSRAARAVTRARVA